jgi:two-component system OmpR family sensor kinase
MRRPLSLRARLVIAVIALATVGLAVANVVTYASLRSFLLDRTDQELRESTGGVARELEHGCPTDGRPVRGISPGTTIQLRSEDGSVVCSLQATGFGEEAPPGPDLPAEIAAPEGEGPGSERTFTVGAVEGDGRYRVQVSNEREGLLVVAAPLADVDATLGRLIRIEAVVTAVVLGALALLGFWLVGVGLRPLDAIGATAAAIADGDLSQRVERAEPATEVGRLGLSLNAMLGQIESAFQAQAASEQRLRRFVADASHELRTPLAAVRAYAELFERGAAQRPEDLARSMAGITHESERMSLLVDDLLLLARLDEGRPLERERVGLDDVVREAVETARTVEPEREIALTTEPADVVGDAHRLRQVVDNLLANARSHTPAGAPVSVTVAASDGHAVIEVADTARASPRMMWGASSSASTGRTRHARGRGEASGSASRSSPRWPTRTAARQRSSRAPAGCDVPDRASARRRLNGVARSPALEQNAPGASRARVADLAAAAQRGVAVDH